MGKNYRYTNVTKKEWFSADALGGSSALDGIGLNLTARAFDLLLVDKKQTSSDASLVEIGRWSGDAISLVGNVDEDLIRYDAEFADLSADIILLVFKYDGFAGLGEAAESDEPLFRRICHLVVTGQAPELEPHVKERFGVSFRNRYKKSCRNAGWHRLTDLIRRQNRRDRATS